MELPAAFSLAEAISDSTRASRACQLAVAALFFFGVMAAMATPEGAQWAERADRHAEPDTVARALADMMLGAMKSATGHLSEGISLLSQAVNLARELNDPDTFWRTTWAWLLYADAPKYADERLHLAEELMEQSRAGVSMGALRAGLLQAGNTFLMLGQRQPAEEALSEHQEMAERSGQVYYLLSSMSVDATVAALDGRLEEAVEICQRIRSRGEELGLREYARLVAPLAAMRPRLYLGEAESVPVRGQMPPAGALLMAYLRQDAEVSEILEQFVMARPGIASAEDEAPAWWDIPLLEAAVLVGHKQAADLLMRRFVGCKLRTTGSYYTTCIARHLGAAAALLGRPEEARAHYQEALKVATEMRFRPEIALTRLQLAELLLEHYPEEKAEALEHLDFAIAEFRDMKMQPSLERALKHKEILGA